MNYELREKVAAFIESTGVLKEARLGQLAQRAGQMAMKARAPLAGAAAGAGGVLGLSAMGQRDQETEQAAAWMRQPLETHSFIISSNSSSVTMLVSTTLYSSMLQLLHYGRIMSGWRLRINIKGAVIAAERAWQA